MAGKRGEPDKGMYHDVESRRDLMGGNEGDTNNHDDDEDEENTNVVNIQNMNNYSDILKKQMAHQQKMQAAA